MMFGLYVHIPFCLKKCRYCDFNSRPARSGEVERYLDALVEEVDLFSKSNRRIVETLYLGGGTPSLLTQEQLSKVFEAVSDRMTLLEDAEITVEANPGTLDRTKAEFLFSCGVNRISLGVQSLRDHHLLRLGRLHTADEAFGALEMLRQTGFDSICVDLMFSLPGQTVREWQEDVRRLLDWRPEHLSLYELTIEKGTVFHHDREQGTLNLPSEDEAIQMFQTARELTAKAGYDHYEISNYALPGHASRHNMNYWTMGEYYGAGAGAHSFLQADGLLRFANVRDPAVYLERMRETKSPVEHRELLAKKTFLAEAMMLGLRMLEGVDIQAFRKQFGEDPLSYFAETLNKAAGNKWIEIADGRIRLTGQGVLFSNEVFADLF